MLDLNPISYVICTYQRIVITHTRIPDALHLLFPSKNYNFPRVFGITHVFQTIRKDTVINSGLENYSMFMIEK